MSVPSGARPPRLAEFVAARALPRATRDVTLGDLHERYVDRLGRLGRTAANRWYVRQAIGFLVRLPPNALRSAATAVIRGVGPATGWGSDVRHAARTILRQRGLSASVIVVLALAVGATTTIFSVVTGVLLRPLPFAAPDALVMLWDEYPPGAGETDPLPATRLHYRAWRDRSDIFASVGAFESMPAVIDAGRWPERIDAALVSADLLPTLGIRPAIGRLFTAEDDVAGAPPVAILSDTLWRSRFGGDRDVIGRSIEVDGEPTRIVGVMPPGFWFYDPYAAIRSYAGANASAARLWRPLAGRFSDELDYPRYRVVARLQPGVTMEAAAAAAAAIERALPPSVKSADGRVRALRLDEQIVGAVRPRLIGLSAAVVLVLVVACVNLVSLFVARFDASRSEFAIRTALGAGSGRLARSLMLHGALLALAGGAAGLIAAALAIPGLLALVPRGLPLAHRVGISPGVAAFAMAVSIGVGLSVSALAFLRLRRGSTPADLATRSRAVAGAFARGRMPRVTIAAEVAISLVLLISATVLLRSFVSTSRTDVGFDASDALTFQSLLVVPSPGAPPPFAFLDQLEARVRALPGVVSVGSASILPFSRWGQTAAIRLPDLGADAPLPRVDYRLVSPTYFETLRVGQLGGRVFATTDDATAPAVAIVNRAFADRHLGGLPSAVGQRLVVNLGGDVEREIVGVVADVREGELFADPRPILYVPLAQSHTRWPVRQFVVRTGTDHPSIVESIRAAAAAIDPRQPLQDFITLDALAAQSLEEERFYAVIAGAFAAIAVVLALAGLYGVVSFAVRQRDREVGIRMALGATPGVVSRMVLADGMRPVVAGLVLGCLGAMAGARIIRGLLHGVHELDPISYLSATAAFAAVAALACLIPARRASGIDPVRTLNQG